jgi:hypothetical protein
MSTFSNAIGLNTTGLGFLNSNGVFIPIPSVNAGNVVTDTGNSLTGFISSPPSVIAPPFVNVTTATQSCAVNTNYYVNFATACTLTLPATAAQGSFIWFQEVGAGTMVIKANVGQTIVFLGGVTSSAGSLTTAVGTGQSMLISCSTANTTWIVMYETGAYIKA